MIVSMKETNASLDRATLAKATLDILQLIVRYLFWITLFLFALWMTLQYTEADTVYVTWIGSLCTYAGVFYILLGLGAGILRAVVLVRKGGVALLPFIFNAVGIMITVAEIILIQLVYAL